MNAHIRPAEKAGSWYSGSPQTLRQEIEEMLKSAAPAPKEPVIGGIAPHAGLAFSGPVAAKTFLAMQQSSPKAQTIIMLGAVHTMLLQKPALWPQGEWECPLGNVPINEDLAHMLLTAEMAEAHEAPHYNDNALELLLPFVKTCFPEASILPVAVPCNTSAAELGKGLAQLFHELIKNGEMAFVASSDLTHYGECYGFAPVGMSPECLDWARGNDSKLLELAALLKADAITATASHDHSACGGGAIAAACALAAGCGSPGGMLLAHTNSHEIMPRPEIEMFVGYASMVFLK